MLINVLVTAFLSAKSTAYLNIESEIKAINDRNREISENLISETALVNIQMRAEGLKMAKPHDIIYLSKKSPIAKLP
ncbi:MAG: hypothetical protein UV74_C0013G0278 [Candidatus Woesebacteria bacterium GW2011_GWB1_43_14]|uniref:Cell division protein FtsL n=1 Tax=Candidatus Woesebacteria bacterium GW2011_GWB1_43_14 TaxID=1618578 RepID=A0A0G1FQ59_9BACT|nr:MAG: hypothetical protein UT21_C0002G0014 [Candidatus Woesebacteria bacterium GW2011_GWA1_39_11b]KKS78427.1 MAG: hypothetical protein UV51_C0001G0143 [Candidatus Woesebacteria bacterium GW2011_GWC1_42_9]KKS97156.1 MAG: hypothetical protein UV74_C0013G0278 [Candidatus Woesebacteria bacterium GW2011_GWB1_43_14]